MTEANNLPGQDESPPALAYLEHGVMAYGYEWDDGSLTSTQETKAREVLSETLGMRAITRIEPIYTQGIVRVHCDATDMAKATPSKAVLEKALKQIARIWWKVAPITEVQFIQDPIANIQEGITPPEGV